MKTNSKIPGSTKLNSRIESNRGVTASFNETSNINKNIKIPRSKQTSTQTSEVSLTSQFDELVKNRKILTSGQTEKKFLTFSINAEKNRQKWGIAEVECQILIIELEKSLEEISSMKCKLKQAREICCKQNLSCAKRLRMTETGWQINWLCINI